MTSLLSTLKVAAAILARPRDRDLTDHEAAALDDIAVRTNASVAQLEAIVAGQKRRHERRVAEYNAGVLAKVEALLPPLGHVVGHKMEAAG